MPSEPTIDIQRLAAPISDEHPAGTYLRETDFDRLQQAKDLRADAVRLERRARDLLMYTEDDLAMLPESERQAGRPDWRAVLDACSEIIAEHSKDLWVATWLIEASVRLNGFAGLRDSFRLIEQVSEKYWDGISPPPDEEEGYVGTLSQLASLNGEEGNGLLILPIREAELIPGHPELNLLGYIQATEGSGGDLLSTDFTNAAKACDLDAMRQRIEDVAGSIEAFDAMNEVLGQRAGEVDGTPSAPPSSDIRKALTQCLETLGTLTQGLITTEDPVEADEESAEGGDAAQAPRSSRDAFSSQINSREDAFRLLLRISDYFRKTEPHNPAGPLLQKAVRLGRMDLSGLVSEVITDDDQLNRFAELIGIETPTTEEESE